MPYHPAGLQVLALQGVQVVLHHGRHEQGYSLWDRVTACLHYACPSLQQLAKLW